jgi:hypothetical protein
MAPIYLAQKTTNPSSGPNIFKAKGITGYIPSTLSSLSVVGLPHVRELAYDGYFRNIDAFLYATSVQRTVFCDVGGYSQFQAREPIDIDHPDVSYVSRVILKPDQETPFMNKIGAFSKEVSGKITVFKVKKPDAKTLQGLINTCSENFASGPDSVTPAGYNGFLFIRDCISEFLATHSYSAFCDKDLGQPGTSEISSLRHIKRPLSTKVLTLARKDRKLFIGDNPCYTFDDDNAPEDSGELAKWLEKEDKLYHAVVIANPKGAVLKAKPSPSKTNNNFGPSSSIPKMSGLAFPYFAGMNTPDSMVFKDITTQHFLRLLGGSPSQVQKAYLALRRGFNSLSTTQEGKELAHMCVGVKLALQAQARLFIIHDGIYRGFCLLGIGFTIIDGASNWPVLDADSLIADLSSFNPHLEGLTGLLEKLNQLSSEQRGEDDIYEKDDLASANDVIEALGKLKIGDDDDEATEIVKELNSMLRKLQFFEPSSFRRIQPQTLTTFLEVILAKPSKEKILSLPFKFTTIDAPYKDPLYRQLAIFGVEGPSPWNASGAELRLEYAVEPEEIPVVGSSAIAKKRRVEKIPSSIPNVLIFSPKPIMVAWKDWKKVIEKKAVRMDVKERAKGYRCMMIQDEKTREDIWGLMVDAVTLLGKTVVPKMDDKTGKGKKRDTEVSTYDDLLAMF